MKITLDLTDRQVELLRNSTSDLGTTDLDCVNLQLQIASAILDAQSQTPSQPQSGHKVDDIVQIYDCYGNYDFSARILSVGVAGSTTLYKVQNLDSGLIYYVHKDKVHKAS